MKIGAILLMADPDTGSIWALVVLAIILAIGYAYLKGSNFQRKREDDDYARFRKIQNNQDAADYVVMRARSDSTYIGVVGMTKNMVNADATPDANLQLILTEGLKNAKTSELKVTKDLLSFTSSNSATSLPDVTHMFTKVKNHTDDDDEKKDEKKEEKKDEKKPEAKKPEPAKGGGGGKTNHHKGGHKK